MKFGRISTLGCLGTAFLLTGCSDLSNIKKFAAASADSANYTSLVTDYEKSAERLRAYEPSGVQAQQDKTIADRKAQQKPLLGMLQGIQSYMNALGALASDQLVTYDQSLSTVTDGLKATQAVTTNEANAFDALTKLLAKSATDAYRRAKLKAVIEEANPHFQIVIQAMTFVVTNGYVASLDEEEDAVTKHFGGVLEAASHAPPQDAAMELVKLEEQRRCDEIDTKRQACLVYVQTLETIGKGHQALFDQRESLTSVELLSTIDSFGKAISQLNTQIKQLK